MTTTWPCSVCGKEHSRRRSCGSRKRTCSETCRASGTARGKPACRAICAAPGCQNYVTKRANVCCSRECRRAHMGWTGPTQRTPKPTLPGEAITPLEALDAIDAPGHLWRLRDEPLPVWRHSGGGA